MFTYLFPGTRLNIQCKSLKTSKPSGKPTNKRTKRSRQQLLKNIENTNTQQNKHNFQTYVRFGRHRSESCWLLFLLVFSMLLQVFPLTSLIRLFLFCFPDGFYIFKCTLDFSQRLGRGCATLLNKAFHFTRVSMFKRLPCIIDFPLQVSSPYIYEGFPLYTLFSCMRDFLL